MGGSCSKVLTLTLINNGFLFWCLKSVFVVWCFFLCFTRSGRTGVRKGRGGGGGGGGDYIEREELEELGVEETKQGRSSYFFSPSFFFSLSAFFRRGGPGRSGRRSLSLLFIFVL